MYSYLIGEIKDIGEEHLILENNGIGYKIGVSSQTMNKFRLNEEYKIYTAFIVRDDGFYLYGFYSKEELDMFYMLTSVSSIGPKGALSVLSTLSVPAIKMAIVNNDVKELTQAPGVGKKTASRIILELSDKIELKDIRFEEDKFNVNQNENYTIALDALVNLGYAKNDASQALASIDIQNLEIQDIIKKALKNIS